MSPILDFSKGLVHVFVKKSSFLPCGLFRKTNAEKIVFEYSGWKIILFRKLKFQKCVKNGRFLMGLVHGFFQKI